MADAAAPDKKRLDSTTEHRRRPLRLPDTTISDFPTQRSPTSLHNEQQVLASPRNIWRDRLFSSVTTVTLEPFSRRPLTFDFCLGEAALSWRCRREIYGATGCSLFPAAIPVLRRALQFECKFPKKTDPGDRAESSPSPAAGDPSSPVPLLPGANIDARTRPTWLRSPSPGRCCCMSGTKEQNLHRKRWGRGGTSKCLGAMGKCC
jgi:hypothetical protein